MTENAEHKFDPDWPHGHLYVTGNGEKHPAQIVKRLEKSPRPLVVVVNSPDAEWCECFYESGHSIVAGEPRYILINAPAPEPTVAFSVGKTVTINMPRIGNRDFRVCVEVLSDGTFRATAKVLP